MIVGIGVDLAKIDRIGAALARFGERFEKRCYTPFEIEFCRARGNPIRSYAMFWAAKEAFSKAVSLGMRGLAWREMEVRHQPSGQPYLVLYGRAEERARTLGVTNSFLTLTDEAGLAAAVVVLEK